MINSVPVCLWQPGSWGIKSQCLPSKCWVLILSRGLALGSWWLLCVHVCRIINNNNNTSSKHLRAEAGAPRLHGFVWALGSALAAEGKLRGSFSFSGAAGELRMVEWLVSLGCPPLETLYVNKFVALCLTLFWDLSFFWSVLGDLPGFPGGLLVGGCWADQDGAVTWSTYLPLWNAGSWPHQYKLMWLQLVMELLCTHCGHWAGAAQLSAFGLLLLWVVGCVIPSGVCP